MKHPFKSIELGWVELLEWLKHTVAKKEIAVHLFIHGMIDGKAIMWVVVKKATESFHNHLVNESHVKPIFFSFFLDSLILDDCLISQMVDKKKSPI